MYYVVYVRYDDFFIESMNSSYDIYQSSETEPKMSPKANLISVSSSIYLNPAHEKNILPVIWLRLLDLGQNLALETR